MKLSSLMFILGIFTFLFISDAINIYDESISRQYMPKGWDGKQYTLMKKEHPTLTTISSWLLQPGIGLYHPLTKRCIPSGTVIDGVKYRGRDYFKCNSIQNFISDIIND